jgi:hypothetical protein
MRRPSGRIPLQRKFPLSSTFPVERPIMATKHQRAKTRSLVDPFVRYPIDRL